MFLLVTGVALAVIGPAAAAEANLESATVTFTKDILPILGKLSGMPRPNNIAPMSLLTYQSTRPWAKAIRAAVVSRKMPPWSAYPKYGHFSNDLSLQQSDVDKIVKWADSGAPEGNPHVAPPARQFPENGWTTKPDIVLNGIPYTVQAHTKSDVIEWMTLVTPTGFTKDTWVTSIEIKPSELAVTHHICASFVPHRADTVYNTMLWTDKTRDASGVEVAPTERTFLLPTADGKGIPIERRVRNNTRPQPGSADANGAGLLGVGFTCYVPGRTLSDFRPFDAGLLIPAGYDVNWTIHYTPNGTELTDRPQIGLTVAKEQPSLLIESFGGVSPLEFAIPPNDGNYEAPLSLNTFNVDAELRWMSPHMHLRGKNMQYKLVFPDGREQIILNVPRYDFNWQLGYDLADPIKVPKGTKLVVSAHYDNSVNNKFNPDPNGTVYIGNMTWEEMDTPFFAITVDKNVNPATAVTIPRGATGGA